MGFRKIAGIQAFLLLGILGAPARGDELGRPLSTGFVYPTLPDSVSANPAALTDDHASAARLAYDDSWSGALASSSGKLGYGAALNTMGAGNLTVGAGAAASSVFRLGVNATLTPASGLNPFQAQFQAGVICGKTDGLRLAATVSDLFSPTSGSLGVGIGYAQSHSGQLELDVSLPLSGAITPTPYTIDASGALSFGKLGLGGYGSTTMSGIGGSLSGITYGAMGFVSITHATNIDFRLTLGGGGGLQLGITSAF